MRILYLGLGVPDMNKSQNLFTELVLEFHKKGHQIDVVAPAREKDKSGLRKEAGVNVLRVPTLQLFNVGFLVKGLANLLLPYQYKSALKKSGLNLAYDLVIIPTPPITLVSLAGWFKKNYHCKFYVILRDIFPQNAVDLKIMSKKNPAYWYFRQKEKQMYRIADFLGCMSQGNIDYVLSHNPWVEKKKLHLLPNWRNLQPLLDREEIKSTRESLGLSSEFLVFFGGNIGKPQKIENIVALIEACQEVRNLWFLIVGDGNERQKLEDMIHLKNLKNVKLLGRVNSERYHQLLQAADVGLISLSEDFTIPNIPSKTLSYFNAKKPILASTDKNTDYPDILKESGAGLWCEAGKTRELKEQLIYLMENPQKALEMGQNGYEYMKNNLLTEMSYHRLMKEVTPP
jgi:glycosyltransferase involved in cell wall biosynthesis